MTMVRGSHLARLLIAIACSHAAPATAQTTIPSGAWTTSSSGATVTTSVDLTSFSPPFLFQLSQPTVNGAFPVTVEATLLGVTSTDSSYNGPLVQLFGIGSQGPVADPQQGYIVGPNFNANISVADYWNTAATSTLNTSGFLAGFPSLLTISSIGAPGAAAGSEKDPGGGAYNAGDGGNVTIQHSGSLLLSVAALSNPDGVTISPSQPIGSAILATSQGGVGSDPFNNNLQPGAGGSGGDLIITTSATSSIAIENAAGIGSVAGINAFTRGGSGGVFYSEDTKNAAWGQAGDGGSISIGHAGVLGSASNLLGNLIGISALSEGGTFIEPATMIYDPKYNGMPPNVGNGGSIEVAITRDASISLATGNGIGVLAGSFSGSGFPYYSTAGKTGIFFPAGTGGSIYVDNAGQITTGNANSIFSAGILSLSSGSDNLIDPFGQNVVSAGSYGFGGDVTVVNTGIITSQGSFGIGIAGLSLGSAGIATGASPEGASVLGSNTDFGAGSNNETAGTAGAVSLNNSGTILTNGASAFGVAAISVPAGGLLLSDINSVFSGSTDFTVTSGQSLGNNASSSAADGGAVSIQNSGTISTGSANDGNSNMAIGILAQSIGGGGGSSGGQGAAAFVGDAGGSGGNGGSVSIMSSGSVATQNDGAIGILSQTIGGGGGNGGNAAGLFVAVGGRGGLGGDGGTIDLQLGSSAASAGSISTQGDFATGVLGACCA